MTRSVLDSGLSVLSLAAGPVLGAFLTGVLTTRVRSGAMLGGMVAGAAVLAWVWLTDAYAFTWYALTGAPVTAGVALLLSLLPASKRGCPIDLSRSPTILRERGRGARLSGRVHRSGRTRRRALERRRSAALTFDPYAPPATPDTIFDLASLTKVIATTTLAMRAVDSGRLTLRRSGERDGCPTGAAAIALRSRSATCSRTAPD